MHERTFVICRAISLEVLCPSEVGKVEEIDISAVEARS